MHFTEILNLAARAWHETKDAADPEFNDCDPTHRQQLGAATSAVVDSEQAFSPFERVVLRLYLADKEAKSKVEQLQDKHPTAHADEIMHLASGAPHPLTGHAEDAARAQTREEFNRFHDQPSPFVPTVFEPVGHVTLDAVGSDKSKVTFETAQLETVKKRSKGKEK